MKHAALVVEPFYQNDRIFDLDDPISNRDNCLYGFWALREAFAQVGVVLATQDKQPIEQADYVIYVEMPKVLPSKSLQSRAFLLLFESALIRPDNWDLAKHARFKKIFTWASDKVDDERYIKIQFNHAPTNVHWDNSLRQRFCCLIAGNKSASAPNELYSAREQAIRWFEAHHPDQFDLYGMGWDQYLFRGRYLAKLNRFAWLRRVLHRFGFYPSYRGRVDSKQATLSQYRFCICYENAKDIPGYITEKLFDCFFAGTVPVYWGAPDITAFVPENAFIDRTKFADMPALYEYLANMPEQTYQAYQQGIREYLNSSAFEQFSAEVFARTIVEAVHV